MLCSAWYDFYFWRNLENVFLDFFEFLAIMPFALFSLHHHHIIGSFLKELGVTHPLLNWLEWLSMTYRAPLDWWDQHEVHRQGFYLIKIEYPRHTQE